METTAPKMNNVVQAAFDTICSSMDPANWPDGTDPILGCALENAYDYVLHAFELDHCEAQAVTEAAHTAYLLEVTR